jgi:hypothetical protein
MRIFELNIFIDCPRNKVYDHLSEPINMIGLRPFLTEIDVLKERKDANGILMRPFYLVETFRFLGLLFYRHRTYSVIHLVKPKEELELHEHGRLGIEVVFNHKFQQSNDGRTQITQTVQCVKAGRLLENYVLEQAKRTQRILFSNLKVRLEKQ